MRLNFKAAGWLAASLIVLLAVGGISASADAPHPAPRQMKDIVTLSDAEFGRRFQSKTAAVNGIKLHYVIGGTGEPLILLHGCPKHGASGGPSCRRWRRGIP